MTSVVQSLSPINSGNVNTFSSLSNATPTIQRSTIPSANTIPIGNTQLSSAQFTGFVSPNAQVVPSNIPVSVVQTINNPPSPRMVSRPPSPRMISRPPSPKMEASQTARSALLNLNTTSTSSVVIPNLSQKSASRLFPSIKVVSPNSSLPLKPTVEIMNQQFEVKDYQGIISNSSLENELLNAGYAPLSKIVIRADGGEKRTQYIKAINKMGQKVFILIDVNGYTTARSTDLTLIEAHNASIVPYSLKTGAYNCAGKDVCGVAFECGSDAVCVLTRAPNDLTPKESNFVFVEQHSQSAATIESEGSIMTYPVIRLSEIRANPMLVLQNTDIVTRRLRNSGYTALLQELATTQQSINKLNEAFVRFNNLRESVAGKLNSTLTQLEQWNSVYMNNPPTTDEAKDKYRALQYNLALRNENIGVLLRSMKKIADLHISIDNITKEINDITEFDEKEFINVDRAVSD